jgi:tRNA nucleotidyltransferase/poly(A) polymerase
MPQIFKVGGCVRDKLLGLESKDIDFTFVLDNLDRTVEEGFQIMTDWLTHKEFTIFLSTPECFTIRAKFPKGHENEGMVADFVLARKEVGYEEGTRRPILELGTLEDDLVRRDFTVNALAEAEDGTIIDLFGGQEHLKEMLLVTPMRPEITFLEDPLRVLRAFRFSITKGFRMCEDIEKAVAHPAVWTKMQQVVSAQRIREELTKCFKADTMTSLQMLFVLETVQPGVVEKILFQDGMWLKPTFEQ